MPAHQNGKSAVITAARESVQQLLIALRRAALRSQLVAQMANPIGQSGSTHDGGSVMRRCCLLLLVPGRDDLVDVFPFAYLFHSDIAEVAALAWLDLSRRGSFCFALEFPLAAVERQFKL